MWCHAKVHDSWAALADDVNPDPEAIAERERRRSREHREAAFESAADRYGHRIGSGDGGTPTGCDDPTDDDPTGDDPTGGDG